MKRVLGQQNTFFGAVPLLTVGVLPLPFTGGPSLFVAGYVLLAGGCALLGVGLAIWRRVSGH